MDRDDTRRARFRRRESGIFAAVRVCLFACLLTAAPVLPVVGQSTGADGEARVRLRTGDFQPGDRIIVVMRGDSTTVDTLVVQSDRTLVLQKLPPIPLDGVLRSDVQSYLGQQIRQYVKRDLLRATPLVPVGVLGEVVHPGYYRVPMESTLGDLLMAAGGPSPQADLTHLRVRRGQRTLVDEQTVRDAMMRGLSLGELGIDAGDEVVVKPVRQRNWMLITQLIGVTTGLVLTFKALKVF
jgi:protein involved in polysaccharide export with SLBB domain